MALLPTQDKELEAEVTKIVTMTHVAPAMRGKLILDVMQSYGYYKGLPDSISEALNSGDGTYRP